MTKTLKIIKVGRSLGIIIPKAFLDTIGATLGDKANVELIKDGIVIKIEKSDTI